MGGAGILHNELHKLTDHELQQAIDSGVDGAETEFALRDWCLDHNVSRFQVELDWMADMRERLTRPRGYGVKVQESARIHGVKRF